MGKPRRTSLGYNATVNKGRRKAPEQRVTSEAVALKGSDRKKLVATVQEQQRNFALTAWMIRQHLDYVSSFKMQINMFDPKQEKLKNLLTRLFEWHAQPENFSNNKRQGREETFRMFEMEKVVAGDAGLIKLKSGSLQAIESDMIAKPTIGKKKGNNLYENITKRVEENVDKNIGCIMKDNGEIDYFCICNRGYDGKSIAFDHLEKRSNMIFDGYFTRFSSQVRGISPLSTALTTIQDLNEGFEWNLLKMKVHSLFGIAMMRDYNGTDSVSDIDQSGWVNTIEDNDTSTDTSETQINTALKDLTPNQILMVDAPANTKIDTIESKTPSAEFVNGCFMTMQIALLALDMPMTMLDSKQANFASRIADQSQYERSCAFKISKNKWIRQHYSDWVIDMAWYSSDWKLKQIANDAGITNIRDVKAMIEWISAGFPWLQKWQQIKGDITAIGAGIDNPVDAARRRGSDAYDNLKKTADFMNKAKELNVPIMIGDSGQRSADEIIKESVTEGINDEQ